ncbi:hypothetical protein TPSD3_01475 [Thioflexithrix psekupsensis]|uniref:Uncharacterized protein n=2 Tax=Thioflexithrix psekupsensis TaxID=1570016 RepID=A0A251XA89_9GAMM|nr:hypothetical protein TPSD3_01475 [Thioflexithrix psekupsensis]
MHSETLTTIEKMIQPLSVELQQQVLVHLREYIAELQSERRWEQLEQSHYDGLGRAAQLARQQIAEGLARPMNWDGL